MAASKPTDRHTHTLPQCCPASVGLAQARPKKPNDSSSTVVQCDIDSLWF